MRHPNEDEFTIEEALERMKTYQKLNIKERRFKGKVGDEPSRLAGKIGELDEDN